MGRARFVRIVFCHLASSRVDPRLDPAAEDRERDGSALEDAIVELAEIEARSERALGFGAKASDLEVARHVRARLSGPRDVAIDLLRRLRRRHRGVLEEESDRAIAIPAERVEAGVDDEPARAPGR